MNTRILSLSLGLLAAAGCSYTDTPTGLAATASLRLVNGAAGSGTSGVVLLVDGAVVGSAAWGVAAAPVMVTPGSHTIEVRLAASSLAQGVQRAVNVANGERRLVVAVAPLAAGAGAEPLIYGDTNTIVPAGATKLRVIHAAALAPAITVRRTQPDYDSLVTVMFPFAYQASSGYIQSTPGTWTVVVSHENRADTLVATGPILIPDGHSRTVLLIDDGTGGVAARVIDP